MRPTILVAESSSFSSKAAECLRRSGRLVLADLERASLLSSVAEADVLWVRLRHRIDREVMDAAPRLRAIATPTTGLNHIDLSEARRRNIEVISLKHATEFLQNVYATAEHTMALIFGLLRHLPAAHRHVVRGYWNRDLFTGRELHGKTAGLIGYGRIGRMVAGYLQSFGTHVLVSDVNTGDEPLQAGAQSVSLGQLLDQADIVSLHVPLTESTRGFFGRDEFARMRLGSWFVNTARGELVAEEALLDALRNGHLAGAALDVLPDERSSGMGTDRLVQYARGHENLLITPHIGGCTTESREKTEEFLATQIVQLLGRQSEVRESTHKGANIFSDAG